MIKAQINPRGALGVRKVSAPLAPLGWRIKNTLRASFLRGWLYNAAAVWFSSVTGIPTLTGELRLRRFEADGSVTDYGVVCRRVVTTAWAELFVDEMQGAAALLDDLRYHDCGTGVTAPAIGDTALGTPYGGARAVGTQAENGSTTYQTVGTISFTSTLAITEHGIFTAASGATLGDRHTFSAVNVDNGDAIQFTYDYTVNTGG